MSFCLWNGWGGFLHKIEIIGCCEKFCNVVKYKKAFPVVGEGGPLAVDEVKMKKLNNPKMTKNAQLLRKNMTKEERHLWYDFLKRLPITVNRQKVIGEYIVDFYIASFKLVIELDGSQHYDEKNIKKDADRDENLGQWGIKVLRYSNLDVNKNFESVCQDILKNINTSSVT